MATARSRGRTPRLEWFGTKLAPFLVLFIMSVATISLGGCGVVLMEPVPVKDAGDAGFDGSVIDIESGAAISNARVRVDWVKDPSIYFEAFTDVQGKFSVRYLRRGNDEVSFKKGERYQITVSSADYRTFRRPETYKGSIQPVEVGLARFEDNQRKPDAPVPPSPDRAIEPYFRAGVPIP